MSVVTALKSLVGVRGRGALLSPADDRDFAPPSASRVAKANAFNLPDEARELERSLILRNQRSSSSCVAHAVDAGVQMLCNQDKGPRNRPYSLRSVSSPYWHGRALDGLQDRDQGSYPRSVLKAWSHLGSPSEATWPLKLLKINTQPGPEAYRDGHSWRGLRYSRIPGDFALGAAYALSDNFPVILSIPVDEAFEQDGGDAEIRSIGKSLGNHMIALCGYVLAFGSVDRAKFRMVNSWGTDWRDGGKAWLSARIVNEANEAWIFEGFGA